MNIGELVATIKADTAPLRRGMEKTRSVLGGVRRSVFSLQGAFAALGLGMITRDFINAASSAEQLRVQLESLTGRGTEMFQTLNKWAAKMPVDTEKAIEVFKRMQAYGLDPTTKKMTILTDASMALTGTTQGLQQISRALGQMAAKGKISAEEINQLAEAGYNARTVLKKQFDLTGTDFENLSKVLREKAVTTATVIKTLFEDMKKQFGGISKAMEDSWVGIMNRIKHQWWMLRLKVMETGPFQVMRLSLDKFLSSLEGAKGQMKLDEYAKVMSDKMLVSFEAIAKGAGYIGDSFRGWKLIWLGLKAAWSTWVYAILEGYDKLLRASRAIYDFVGADTSTMIKINTALLDLRYTMKGLSSEIEETAEEIRNLAKQESNVKAVEREFEKIRKKAKEMAAAMKDVKDTNDNTTKNIINNSKDVGEETAKTFDYMEEMSKGTAQNMQSNFSNLFFDAAKGELNTFSDYWTAFSNSLLRTWSDVMSKILAQYLYGMKFMRGESGKMGGVFGALVSGVSTAISGYSGGGYSGLKPGGGAGSWDVKSYQHGGLISEPVFGVGRSGKAYSFAETGPEYVTPEQGLGKLEPITVNIIAADSQSITDMMRRNPQAVVGPFMDQLKKGNQGLRSALKGA